MTKNTDDVLQEQEWSHFINTDTIDTDIKHLEIVPSEKNIERLCHRLNLLSIENLRAQITLQRNELNKVIHIHGNIVADVRQACVVSAEPVADHIEDAFDAWYAEPNQAVSFTKARRERMEEKEKTDQPILEEEDDPEPVIEGKIDLGELAVQYLSLALNPYPRKEDVRSQFGELLEEAPEGTYNNPFAALKEWKMKEKKKDS